MAVAMPRVLLDLRVRKRGREPTAPSLKLLLTPEQGRPYCRQEALHREAAHHIYREHAGLFDRYGGLCGSPLSSKNSQGTRSRSEAHAEYVREIDRCRDSPRVPSHPA